MYPQEINICKSTLLARMTSSSTSPSSFPTPFKKSASSYCFFIKSIQIITSLPEKNMFGQNHSDYSPDFHAAQQTPMFLPPLAIPEHDCVSSLRSEISSGCSSYGGSPTSITSYMIPRSNSFHKNMDVYSPMYSSPPGYFECESSSVRKVLSAGDLQVRFFRTMQHVRESI